MRISEWFRLWQIQTTILRYGLLEIIIDPNSRFQPLIHLRLLNPWYWRRNQDSKRGERLRLALQELGPFFVKFGQLLSTRRDILPDDIADELSKLQDQVAPFTTPDVTCVVSEALGQPVNEIFTNFDPIPLASASIAQVHCATLPDGEQVVLKVLRPGIQKIIQRDVFLLKALVRKIAKHVPQGERLIHVINEIEQTIFSELDLLREAANMSQLQRQQQNCKYLHIPKVFWALSRKNLLVLERIHGIPLTDSEAVRNSGVDRKVLAERLVQLFFQEVFDHGFFHADLHAGNLFLGHNKEHGPQIIMVDFGIVGILSSKDLAYLAENLSAFLKSDYQRIAELHIESGWAPPDTRVEQFALAIGTVCEPILARPLKEISFGQILMRLLQAGTQFNVRVQPQLILLQKTLITVEGLSRHLDPDVDFFDIAKPIVEKWMKQRISVRGFLNQLKKYAPRYATQLPALPELMYQYLDQTVKSNNEKNYKRVTTDVTHHQNNFWSGVGATTLLGGVLLSLTLAFYPPLILEPTTHSFGLLISGALGLLGIGCLLYSRSGK